MSVTRPKALPSTQNHNWSEKRKSGRAEDTKQRTRETKRWRRSTNHEENWRFYFYRVKKRKRIIYFATHHFVLSHWNWIVGYVCMSYICMYICTEDIKVSLLTLSLLATIQNCISFSYYWFHLSPTGWFPAWDPSSFQSTSFTSDTRPQEHDGTLNIF
jgi:hypothetical protein